MKKKLSLFLVMILMFSAWPFAVAEETDALPAQWVNASVVGNVSEETSTDPADDYYLYVNKQWLLDTTLTDTKYYITWFSQGQDLVTEQVAGLLSGELSQDHDASQTQLFYQQYLDMDTRNALGEAPLLPYLEKIESISTMEDLDAYVLDDDALSTLIGWTITTDMMDASRYIAYLGGASLSLDDADEYQELTDLGARKKAALTKMLEEMLQLCGYTQEEAAAHVENMFAFEYDIAGSIYGSSVTKQADYLLKTYNLFTPEELAALAPNLPIAEVIAKPVAAGADVFVLEQPDWLVRLNELYVEENLQNIKSYLLCNAVTSAAAVLDQRFIDLSDEATSTLIGMETHTDIEQVAYNAVSSLMPWAVGKLYADAYGSQELNQRVEEIIDQIVEVYHTRLEANTWLGEETRARAIEKLEKLRVRVGYPDDWEPYEIADLTLQTTEEGGTLLSNMLQVSQYYKQDLLEEIGQEVDKDKWVATPQTVNAYYSSMDNSINIPSAIFAPILSDGDISDERLLGMIGTVIGHEITHGFDTTGSQFDADGNFSNWWTDEDRAAFEARTKKVETYYSAIEALPGHYVDGVLTIGETVADLGGMSSALEVAKGIEGFDYDEFFRSYAELWALKTTEEMYQVLLQDVHAPNYLRANVNVQQFEEFYETYDVHSGDGMYLAPEERLSVW